MNKENNKTKTKIKLNAFDIFVLVLILCLIATFAYKVYTSVADDQNSENSSIMLSFVCENEFDSIISYLHEGDKVYLESGEILGYIHKDADKNEIFITELITEGSVSENTEVSENQSEKYNYSKINFEGKLRLNGNTLKSNKGSYYIIGEDNITVGGTLKVHTTKTEFTITVTEIGNIDKY